MNRSRTIVLAAVALVVLLAGTLGVRLLGREPASASKPAPARLARFEGAPLPARVPDPKPAAALSVPCWGCPGSDGWPVRFRTDLDLLAPLGDGEGNAALWFKDFARQVGAREEEGLAAMKRRVDGPAELGKVLPADDPLLLEAEPWADRATMRFYPDVFPIEGFETRIPDLLLPLTLARSWVARAESHPDAATALDDCRRAIRLGRLLRQEDATIIQDLVGLACIRAGAQGIYDVAARRGDQPLMLVSAIVLGEHAPQRLRTAQIVTKLDMIGAAGGAEVTDRKVDDAVSAATGFPDRRFRGEAILQLAIVRSAGSSAQRSRAEKVLDELAASPDPVTSGCARWARAAKLDPGELEKIAGGG